MDAKISNGLRGMMFANSFQIAQQNTYLYVFIKQIRQNVNNC